MKDVYTHAAGAPTDQARVCLAAPPPASTTLPVPSTRASHDGQHVMTVPEPSAWESPCRSDCIGLLSGQDAGTPLPPLAPTCPALTAVYRPFWCASGALPCCGSSRLLRRWRCRLNARRAVMIAEKTASPAHPTRTHGSLPELSAPRAHAPHRSAANHTVSSLLLPAIGPPRRTQPRHRGVAKSQ
jgi:hypothetical protein